MIDPRRLAIMLHRLAVFVLLSSAACASLPFPALGCPQDHSPAESPRVVVLADGTVQVPAETVPVSTFLSPEAKRYLAQHLRDMQDPEILKQDAGVPRFMKGYLARDYELFSVEKQDQKVGGVHAYVYTPKTGVST